MSEKNTVDVISIVIPIYNCEKYIAECVESLLVQTYQNIEIVLVDDGSSDRSGEICDSYAGRDSRVVVIHQKNQGVSAARNNGIQKCSGKYITFVDSDDYVEKDYCEYLYRLSEENDADVSLTPQPYKFSSCTKADKTESHDDGFDIWTGAQAAVKMLYYKIVISSWNKMFRTKMLKENGIAFNTNLSYGEGFSFVINSFLHSRKVVCGHRMVYNYRVDNANSVMTNFKEKLVSGSIEALHTIKEMSDEQEFRKAWEYADWHTHCDCFNTILGCRVKKKYLDLYKRLGKVCRKKALVAMKAPVSFKEKMKAVIYFVHPLLAAKIINKTRRRTFSKAVEE